MFPKFDNNITEPPISIWPNITTIIELEVTPFKLVTVGILLTIISLFGLVGNVVAIIVLSNSTMKGSFSSLLIGK